MFRLVTPTHPLAQPTVIERAVSADPSKLRATIVRGATIGVDRLVLDWLV